MHFYAIPIRLQRAAKAAVEQYGPKHALPGKLNVFSSSTLTASRNDSLCLCKQFYRDALSLTAPRAFYQENFLQAFVNLTGQATYS